MVFKTYTPTLTHPDFCFVNLVDTPAPPPGIGLQVAQTLEGMTGWNVTGMYARVIRSKEFDRTRDEAEGFVRLTDRNYNSLVSPSQAM
jgi:hypothetical protein